MSAYPNINIDDLDEAKARFLFEQVQLSLKQSIEASDALAQKAQFLTNLLLTASTFTAGYWLTHPGINPWPFGMAIICYVFAGKALLKCLQAASLKPLGNHFEHLATQTFLDYSMPQALLAEAASYQARLEQNQDSTHRRAAALASAIKWLFLAPAAGFAAGLIRF